MKTAVLLLVVLLGLASAAQAQTSKAAKQPVPPAHLISLDQVPATIWVKDARNVDQVAQVGDMYVIRYKPQQGSGVITVIDRCYDGLSGDLVLRVDNLVFSDGHQEQIRDFGGLHALPDWPNGYNTRVKTQLSGAQQRAHNTQARG